MELTGRLNLDDFPDSPYAAELRRGTLQGPFAPPLEAAYIRRHVDRMHLRARIWFALHLLFEIYFLVDQIIGTGALSWGGIVHLTVMAPLRLILALLAWSPLYRRLFLPVSRILVPIVHVAMALLVAQALARGRDLQLATCVLMLVGVFSFCGLLFRNAAFTAGAMVITLAFGMLMFGTPEGKFMMSMIMCSITVFIAGVVYRDAERSDRRNFLEHGLIEELVARDGLTTLMNRRAFDEHLVRIWQHALRDRRAMCVLMIDIDYFKTYNDAHGHQAGDAALRSVAKVLKGFARRPLDLAARYGGEEFAIILYDLPAPYPQYVAEQIRMAVENLQIAHNARPNGGVVTVSIGGALIQPTLGRSPAGAVQFADEALYMAKQEGRNRTVMRESSEYQMLSTGSFDTARVAAQS